MEVSAELYKGGRITIPVQIRNLFNMHGGDQLTFRVEDNAITVLGGAQRRVTLLVLRYGLKSRSKKTRGALGCNESATPTPWKLNRADV